MHGKVHSVLKDNRTRSLLKSISYRVISTLITIGVSWMVTRSFKLAYVIGGFDVIIKLAFYYLHERIWHRSKVGRH